MKKIILTILISLLFTANQASAVSLYVGAANQVAYQDQTFLVEWYLDTQDEEINTVYLKLKFSKNALEVVDTSVGGSALNLWIKLPEVSNDLGTIELTGGISGGIKSDKVPIFTTTFKPKQTGSALITMDESSTILLSDGEGTSTSLLFNQLKFTVQPADAAPYKITSPTHPSETDWYKSETVEISFDPKANETYSFSFSSNAEVIPDDKPDDVKSGKLKFENITDGIYYFKLSSKTSSGPWQESGVFRVQIDRTPPENFKPEVASDPAIFNGKPFISFTAVDQVSGVDHYEIRFGSLGRWNRTDSSVVQIPGIILGDVVEIKVVDAAGNEQIQRVSIDELSQNSLFRSWIIWAIMLIGLVFVFFGVRLYRYFRKKYTI
ncbi:MAG TPA: hypothetical protein VD998_01475 [Verrucomicrobiae bacterium]|nr:hypothetical protein [Verrucomicrobiae bacterium]